MPVRLSKIAREFNVGVATIVEFLHEKGIKISSDPNTKLSDENYALVAKEFSSDSEVKKESTMVDLKNTRKKKETVSIDDMGIITEKNDDEEEFISVKDEVKLENKIKVVDHIDLNTPAKVQKEPEAEPVQQQPEPEPKETEKPVAEEKTTQEVPAVKPEEEKENTETDNNETPFKITQPTVKDVKVVGSIDLDSINQRTRPPKKSKQEKERDRKELKKVNRVAVPIRTETQNTNTNTNSEENSEDDGDIRKKRKRIHRSDEKVAVNPSNDKNSKIEENKKKLKKLKKKKQDKTEISEEDVDKQIKDTFARLGNKGKSAASKHRRDKRDAVQQKLQAEMEQEEKDKSVLKLTEFVTVAELATMMSTPVTDIISACMSLGLFVSINQRLDAETINLVADEFGFSVEFVSIDIQEAIEEEEDSAENMLPRPPIVTVMGHVDHGKTSLLDYIRKTNVIAGEAGGITQHIGAYNVKLSDGRAVTFLDTPGHEAFTAMRARGAQVTDIAIIIIAADDNVMPQTIEAINHASAAGVPIVFAINKIDKPGANPDKIREELANMNYLVEEWGGKYQCQEIAAKKGLHIEELLEKVLLEAELLDLKANPHKKAVGSIIESSLDKGRGYIATVLVQSGTLKVGDVVLAGQYFGHVKAMFNERGIKLEKAGPSEPTLILGLNGAPQAGDKFNVMANEKEARLLANKREQLQREQGLRTQKHITLDEIGRRIAIGNFQELNIIVKADVDGSIEALSDSLIKLSTDEIQVNVIHKAVGQISEGDVMLAAASNAIIVGFQVRPSMSARKLAEKEQIDIRLYSIIYTAIEEIKAAMEGMLSPEIKEEVVATVEVLETFKISKVGTIAGCIVRDGKIARSSKIRIIRDGIVIYTGELGSLKRFKDDVKEVSKGFECGLNITNYNDLRIGDMIEAFEEVEIKKTL
ncbi:translation initiation factor IF-2 [Culturomica massiliensis]|jgi:translation initiation factor IF-2|uniref:translation initiation factor IF-2 n=1 Tax=Culturomica massiliensis TaxID=1841857 RepID=UPI00033C0534|nr:translation initiation factor IF-2 [Culturomica massiliensis]CCZ09664.1 translation initiation factor IF-2 [Odoribacter sp. CAG:788]